MNRKDIKYYSSQLPQQQSSFEVVCISNSPYNGQKLINAVNAKITEIIPSTINKTPSIIAE